MLKLEQCRTLMRVLLQEPVTEEALAELKTVSAAQLESWLLERMIATLAYRRFKEYWPELAARLQGEAFMTSAENSLHLTAVQHLLASLASVNIVPTLLKGSVLAHTVYDDPSERPMVDIDIWASAAEMAPLQEKLIELGYKSADKDNRPQALQELMQGTIDYIHPQWRQGNVDLHWSPFNGWWFHQAASIDQDIIWSRRRKFTIGNHVAWELAPENLIIHLCVHLSIKTAYIPHTCFRAFSDIAHVIKETDVDWQRLISDAKAWGVATTVWHTFSLLNQVLPMADVQPVLKALQPSWFRRKLLNTTVSADSILAGRKLAETKLRFLITLSAIDTPKAVAKYLLRTAWPDMTWLKARYGPDATRRQHFITLLIRE